MKRTLIAAIALGVSLAFAGIASAADSKMAAGNAEHGKKIYRKCKACHSHGPNAKNKVGPEQNGLIGRKAGIAKGYRYSKAMKTAAAGGLVWTEEDLDKFLTKPRKFLKGTKMAFAGIRKAQDRADLIAYLKTFK